MQNIVRTYLGADVQTSQLMGLPLRIRPHTTLNEKLNIHEDVVLAANEIPRMRYIGIGNGGIDLSIGAGGLLKIKEKLHLPDHTALYNQLPFVLREQADDLSPVERAKYRLRRLEEHGGKTYVAYYLMLLDLTTTVTQMDLKTVVDGVTYSTPFEHTLANMNPVPPLVSNTGSNMTTGEYVSVTAKVPFIMTPEEVRNYLDVAKIIYGDEGYANIGEIALCSGVDREVMGNFNGAALPYTDSVAVQVNNFVTAAYVMSMGTTGINTLLNLGAVEPTMVSTPA